MRRTMSDPTPIHTFAPFDPDRVRGIIQAFDDACRALPGQPPSDEVRAILAKRITELAQTGERDPARLCERALEHVESVLARGGEP